MPKESFICINLQRTIYIMCIMRIKISSIFLCLFLVCACEKLDTNPENSSEELNRPTLTVSDILNGDFESDSEIWLIGYIVGYVNGSSMSSSKFAAGNKASNIILADSPFETSFKNCVPVQLSNTSTEKEKVRNALNLSSKPENLKHKVKILGTIANYMSTNGITKARRYEFLKDNFDYDTYYREHQNNENTDNGESNTDVGNEDNQFDDEEDGWPDEDETNDEGTDNDNDEGTDNNNDEGSDTDNNDGTDNSDTSDSDTDTSLDILAKTQFTVSEITGPVTTAMQKESMTSLPLCKVKGYIVGFINGNNISSTSFTSNGAKETNIVLADSPNETDYTKCIAVQLSTSSSYKATREALNLKVNPGNLGRCVTVMGTLEKYMGRLGLKNTSQYSFE